MTKSVEEQMADIERRMKQLRARKQRIVARENAKARKRRTHLIIRLGGILSNEGVLGYDEGVWNDEGNRQRLLDMLKAHAAELRAWASDAGVRLPSAESAGELREQVRDLPQEPQIQEQPGYGYQPGFQQPQQWQQQPWGRRVRTCHRARRPEQLPWRSRNSRRSRSRRSLHRPGRQKLLQYGGLPQPP